MIWDTWYRVSCNKTFFLEPANTLGKTLVFKVTVSRKGPSENQAKALRESKEEKRAD